MLFALVTTSTITSHRPGTKDSRIPIPIPIRACTMPRSSHRRAKKMNIDQEEAAAEKRWVEDGDEPQRGQEEDIQRVATPAIWEFWPPGKTISK
jgi:hypothetical protein